MGKTVIVRGSVRSVSNQVMELSNKGYKPIGGIAATGDRCDEYGSSVHHAEMAQTMHKDDE